MAITGIVFGIMTCHFGKSLGRSDAYAYRHPRTMKYLPMQLFSPFFEILFIYSIKEAKRFIYRIAEIVGCSLSDECHDSSGDVTIEFIIAAKCYYGSIGKKFGQLVIWCNSFYSKLFGFIASCHDTAVIITKYNDRTVAKIRSKDTFATDITVITVNYGIIHRLSLPPFDSPYDDSPDLEFVKRIYPYRLIFIISRFQFDISVFPMCGIKVFHSKLLIDKSHDDISVFSFQRAIYDGDITIIDACIHHGVTVHPTIECRLGMLNQVTIEVE